MFIQVMYLLKSLFAQQTRIGGGQPCGGGEVQLPAPDLQQQFTPFPQLHWPALCCEYSTLLPQTVGTHRTYLDTSLSVND